MMRRWGLEDDEVHYKTGLCTRRVRFSAFKNSFTDVKQLLHSTTKKTYTERDRDRNQACTHFGE